MDENNFSLTVLGTIAYKNEVLTSPKWWQNLVKELNRLADEDVDYLVLLEERIRGMQELHDYVLKHGLSALEYFDESSLGRNG